MKKYIAPAIKYINVQGENLIATSLNNDEGGRELSNERDRSVSGSIWGDESLY